MFMDNYIHDMHLGESTLIYNWYMTATKDSKFENITLTGGTGNGFYVFTDCSANMWDGIFGYSIGTAATDMGFITGSNGNGLQYIRDSGFYNCPDDCISVMGPFILDNVDIDTSADGGFSTASTVGSTFWISDLTVDNALYGVKNLNGSKIYLYNFQPSNIGTADIYNHVYSNMVGVPGLISSHNQDGVADDDRIYLSSGVIYRNTDDDRSGACMQFDPSDAASSMVWALGTVKVTSTASPITLKVYLKDDAGFNGQLFLYATIANTVAEEFTEKTPTTSYVENTIEVATGDLINNEYLILWGMVNGTAGNVFFDDFSYTQ